MRMGRNSVLTLAFCAYVTSPSRAPRLMESLISPFPPSLASAQGGQGGVARAFSLAPLWRSHACPADCQRPTLALSWTLALVLACLAISLFALTQPITSPVQLLKHGAAGPEGAASAELAFLEMSAPLADEPPPAAATEPSVSPPLPDLSAALATPLDADLPTADLTEVLTAEDVFEVPPAAPLEDLLQPETPRPVREPQTAPPERTSRPSSTPPSRSSAPSSGSGSTMASGGTTGGTGSGTGGGSKGYFPSPPYPAVARSRGMQGTVQLSITFGPDGRVTSANVARSSGYSELDRAAADWVRRRWRGGSGQVGTFRQPVNFRLR